MESWLLLLVSFFQVNSLIAWTLRSNVHASLLPKHRGGAPIHYALIQGDEEAGVTIMEMVKEMDAGDMISRRSIPITDEDNVGTLFEKLALVGRDLLLDTYLPILLGNQTWTAGSSRVTFSPNIKPEEEKLDWTKSNRQLFNQIRGMNPWPVAHTFLKGDRFKIYEALPVEGQGNPGEIPIYWQERIGCCNGWRSFVSQTSSACW